jgi:hypothetical protein
VSGGALDGRAARLCGAEPRRNERHRHFGRARPLDADQKCAGYGKVLERQGRNAEMFERTMTVMRVVALGRLVGVGFRLMSRMVSIRVVLVGGVVVMVVVMVVVVVVVVVVAGALVPVRVRGGMLVRFEAVRRGAPRAVLVIELVVDGVPQRKHEHARHEQEQAEKAGTRRSERQRDTHRDQESGIVLIARARGTHNPCTWQPGVPDLARRDAVLASCR